MSAREGRDRGGVVRVPLNRLRAHPRNVRSSLGDLRELAESIAHEGVLVPLMAERRGDMLQLLHGHRRWAAARIAGLATVPVVVVGQHSEDEAIGLMMAENLSRAELSPADRWAGVEALRELGGTYAVVARRLGVSVATLFNWRKAASAPAPENGSPATSPRKSRRRPDPRVSVRALYAMAARWADAAPAELVAELRELINGWEPSASDQAEAADVH